MNIIESTIRDLAIIRQKTTKGTSATALANEFNVSTSHVYKITSPKNTDQKRINDERRSHITLWKYINAGFPTHELVGLGFSETLVRNFRAEYKIGPLPLPRGKIVSNKKLELDNRNYSIIDSYNAFVGVPEIAKSVGLSESRIIQILKENDIELRAVAPVAKSPQKINLNANNTTAPVVAEELPVILPKSQTFDFNRRKNIILKQLGKGRDWPKIAKKVSTKEERTISAYALCSWAKRNMAEELRTAIGTIA